MQHNPIKIKHNIERIFFDILSSIIFLSSFAEAKLLAYLSF